MTTQDLQTVLTDAAEMLGWSPAQLDFALTGGIDWDETASLLSASGAIRWAVEDLAASRAGLPRPGEGEAIEGLAARRRAAGQRLLDETGLRQALNAYASACRSKEYVGWSRWSPGPVRYADEPRPSAVTDLEADEPVDISGYPVDRV